jgi:3-phenylpropionate/trans-cinnamate dioxygenase ferredoxin component
MPDFQTVAKLDEIPDGGMKQVVVKGDLVGLYRVGADVYAMGDVCTHEEAYLTEGDFDPDELEVECPLHESHFNVATGQVRILPATRPEPIYPVRIEGDLVLVGSPNIRVKRSSDV